MKVLVIGSGGREHALVWKLACSGKVGKVYAAPGNGGTAAEDKCENLVMNGIDPASEEGQKMLFEFAQKENIDLTVVGPEAPLDAGIADKFRTAGLAIVGPGKSAALLESSKVYSKSFMEKYGVRAAGSKNFTDLSRALEHTKKHFGKDPTKPLVIKADGLAAGKGVVITANAGEAMQTIRAFMKDKLLGEAGKKVIIEDYLAGVEISVMAAVSVSPGKKGVIKPFIAARDHKRLLDGDMGPNTGGMGAIAPVPDFSPALEKDFHDSILFPTLKGMEKEKMDYRGFIFFGLMVQDNRTFLLEYNVRLGDPEAQALLPLMDSDLADLCTAILNGKLSDYTIKWKEGAVCAPVIAAGGYPGTYRKGDPIAINPTGLNSTGAIIFAAGASRGSGGVEGSGLRTNGGRVLAVSGYGLDAEDARKRAYKAINCISFDDMQYRADIGLPSGGNSD
ncbi:MAG: phosphoribosylamine--glycine ligase [Treponema sp.]|nr:phosphoribosylamine--glycine ligase [Treponema sp.]